MVEFGTMMTMLVCSITKDDVGDDGNIKKKTYVWLKHYWNEENEYFPTIKNSRGET